MAGKAKQLRVALAGTGIFAREAHVPAWLKLGDKVQIAAIWSRSRANAEALAASLPGTVRVADDFSSLLNDPTIDAVDIVLPIDAQPALVKQALGAGKHVVSEKPIAENVAQAHDLIGAWQRSDRVWMVAENWRYESAFREAAALIQDGAIGAPVTVSWVLHTPVGPDNKYFHTPWRRTGQIAGGFLLDGGVHHMAALRAILGEIAAVRAEVRQVSPDLPPADTLSATLHFSGGAIGCYLATYAVGAFWDAPLQIVGTEGSMRVDRGWIETARQGETTVRRAVNSFDGVEAELAAFVDAVVNGKPHVNGPLEALRDLAVIEAMLTSARSGHVEIVDHVG